MSRDEITVTDRNTKMSWADVQMFTFHRARSQSSLQVPIFKKWKHRLAGETKAGLNKRVLICSFLNVMGSPCKADQTGVIRVVLLETTCYGRDDMIKAWMIVCSCWLWYNNPCWRSKVWVWTSFQHLTTADSLRWPDTQPQKGVSIRMQLQANHPNTSHLIKA